MYLRHNLTTWAPMSASRIAKTSWLVLAMHIWPGTTCSACTSSRGFLQDIISLLQKSLCSGGDQCGLITKYILPAAYKQNSSLHESSVQPFHRICEQEIMKSIWRGFRPQFRPFQGCWVPASNISASNYWLQADNNRNHNNSRTVKLQPWNHKPFQTFVYFGLFAREIEISLNQLEPRDLTVDLILNEG